MRIRTGRLPAQTALKRRSVSVVDCSLRYDPSRSAIIPPSGIIAVHGGVCQREDFICCWESGDSLLVSVFNRERDGARYFFRTRGGTPNGNESDHGAVNRITKASRDTIGSKNRGTTYSIPDRKEWDIRGSPSRGRLGYRLFSLSFGYESSIFPVRLPRRRTRRNLRRPRPCGPGATGLCRSGSRPSGRSRLSRQCP